MECPRILLIVFIALYYTYTMAKHQYLRKRVMHAFALWPYIVRQPARFRKSDPIWGKRTANKWPQKCDGGPYNGADSVHWSFIYIYLKELPIYKKESASALAKPLKLNVLDIVTQKWEKVTFCNSRDIHFWFSKGTGHWITKAMALVIQCPELL